MGSLSDSPTMGRSVQLCLAALLCCGIQGASLPYQDGYEFHFNQMGVRLDLAMKDLNPLVGGKAHVELPISPVWNLLQKDAQLLRPVINILEKTTLPIWELLDTKVPSLRPVIIRLEQLEKIIPKNNVVVPKRIIYPMEMIFTPNWPNAHTLTIKGDLGKILVNIANDMNEVSVRGVVEYLGQQYKYSTILSIRQRSFTARVEGPSQKTHDIEMKLKMMNGFPMIEITGNTPACHLFTNGQTQIIMHNWYDYEIQHSFHGEGMFTMKMYLLNGFPRVEITGNIPPECQLFYAGEFKTEMIVNNWFNYEIKHIFNGMEMLNVNLAVNNGRIEMIVKYGQTHKTHIVMDYQYLRWIKILLPTTNTWISNELGFEMHYQPTNEEKHLEGGIIKIVAMRDNNPIMKIGGYYGLTLDSTKYEILLKNFYINMMNKEVTVVEGITFSELKYSGRIFFDRMNGNKFLPKVSMEAKIQ